MIRKWVAYFIVLPLLISESIRAESGYPETSWAVVRARRSEKRAPESNRKSIRVYVIADSLKQPTIVTLYAFAGTRDGAKISVSDIEFETATLASPGWVELKVGDLSKRKFRYIAASAPDFLPAGVIVESADVEIEFILVPDLSKR